MLQTCFIIIPLEKGIINISEPDIEQKLNSQFNGHRSDVNVKPNVCELSQHFHNNKECSIDRDLKVYILQDNVTGSWGKREYFEDRWMTRLNSKAPSGMNSNLKEFAKTFYALF